MSRFTLTNLLLLVAVAATASLAYSYRVKLQIEKARADSLESELNNSRPIPFGEVAWQVRQATKHVADSKVPSHSIFYNSLRDQYHLNICWTDKISSVEMATGITFEPNGDGSYTGLIVVEPFAKRELAKDGRPTSIPFYITIKDNVRLLNDLRIKQGFDPLINPNWRTQD